ncbi:S8 family peptidase [Aquimarina rhabdastrellae]
MKNIQKLIILSTLFLIFSCNNDDLLVKSFNDFNSNVQEKRRGGKEDPKQGPPKNMPKYSDTELVIQYKDGTTAATKDTLRNYYNVLNYEVCHCESGTIEKWMFANGVQIEPKKEIIEDDADEDGELSGEGILEVDLEFSFDIETESSHIGGIEDISYLPYIKGGNTGVTIAVLDTGLDLRFSVFNELGIPHEFLYKEIAPFVDNEASGWDFVNKDHNAYDDHPGKHGTIVTYRIHKILNALNIDHQIMPMKVSSFKGKSSYFNFVCGTLNAAEKADIIQMSLGWYDDGSGEFIDSIMANLLETYEDVIFTTSAGNNGTDNDSRRHYPSSYDYPNVIAVAAANEYAISLANEGYEHAAADIATFSNYGENSVDFFAVGEKVPFYDNELDGTSFAAPVLAAAVAKIMNSSGSSLTAEATRMYLDNMGTAIPNTFNEHKKTKYHKIILLDE